MLRLSGQRTRSEAGRASIEFLVFALFGLVPMVWGVQSLWAIQGAAIATEHAARDGVRAFVQQTSPATAQSLADNIARRVVAEHGVLGPVSVQVSCDSPCLRPGGVVRIRVSSAVTLWQSPVWPETWPSAVAVSGEASAKVSVYGGAG